MDWPTVNGILTHLQLTLFLTGCVVAVGSTVLYVLGKRAERRRQRRDRWGS